MTNDPIVGQQQSAVISPDGPGVGPREYCEPIFAFAMPFRWEEEEEASSAVSSPMVARGKSRLIALTRRESLDMFGTCTAAAPIHRSES